MFFIRCCILLFCSSPREPKFTEREHSDFTTMLQNTTTSSQVAPETWADYISWANDFGYTVALSEADSSEGEWVSVPSPPPKKKQLTPRQLCDKYGYKFSTPEPELSTPEPEQPTPEPEQPTPEPTKQPTPEPTEQPTPEPTEPKSAWSGEITEGLRNQLRKAHDGSASAVNPIVWGSSVEAFSSAVSFGTGGPLNHNKEFQPLFTPDFVKTRRPYSMTINGTTHALTMGMCLFKGGASLFAEWYQEARTISDKLQGMGWGIVNVHHHLSNELEGNWTTKDIKNYIANHEVLDKAVFDLGVWENKWENRMVIALTDRFKPKPKIVTMVVDGKVLKTWAVPEDYSVRVSFGRGNTEENVTTMQLTDEEEEGISLV